MQSGGQIPAELDPCFVAFRKRS